ncbi:MAG: DNA ligase (NAD(+)) LigA, partial [Candidatus Cloacimonetes bacterium HGW-Cloacimonetes-1]
MLYYELANPLITDYEYDQLVAELQHLEAQLPESAQVTIPIPKVGSDLSSGAKVKAHLQRMYSLDNAYSLEELRAYLQKIATDTGSFPETHLEHKIDGFSINLFYDKGNLIYATTRGDGFEGEDVTTNILTLPQIPSHIEFKEAIEIRGEVYIPLQEFLELNETRWQNDDKIFANPRNAAAGSIKLKNPEEVKTRSLRALFYSIGYCEKLPVDSQADLIAFLAKMGFSTSPDSIVA